MIRQHFLSLQSRFHREGPVGAGRTFNNAFSTPDQNDGAAPTSPETGAEDVKWNLGDLFPDAESLRDALKRTTTDAEAFADAHRTRVAGLEAEDFEAAMQSLEAIQDTAGKAYTYAYLSWSTDTGDARRGALLQEVMEVYTRISTLLVFFDLEFADVDDDAARRLLDDERLQPYRHHLELQRERKEHLLTEAEEKILVEKSVTGSSAWTRFFDEEQSRARYELGDESLSQQETLARLHDGSRETRKDAARAFTEGLRPRAKTLAFVFNTLLSDKATDDRLRNYSTWISDRNLANEVDDDTVESLIQTVTGRYDIVARYYMLKKRLLDYDELFEYDRYAPVGESDRRVPWDEAKRTVSGAYSAFHADLGTIVERFFDDCWIDAAVSQGKRGGAFSHGAVPSVHPYILMNYTGRVRDVQTLAHELGHGVHQFLSREQGIFHAGTPLTTAETASVFGEMLTFHRLLDSESDPGNRLGMLMGKIDDTFATVFRQVSMNRFEDRIHTLRRTQGELSVEQFSDAWFETQQPMFGDSVTLTDDYRIWWSYIPHFLHTPGYVYAYAFGELLVLALYQKYLDEGASFADQYMDLLKSGGSDYPHVLLNRMDIDLQDRAFWSGGTAAIERLVVQAESLADEMDR